jgi:hypothetical protein
VIDADGSDGARDVIDALFTYAMLPYSQVRKAAQSAVALCNRFYWLAIAAQCARVMRVLDESTRGPLLSASTAMPSAAQLASEARVTGALSLLMQVECDVSVVGAV